MLTWRGFSLLIVILLKIGIGLGSTGKTGSTLAVLGLSFLAWFSINWALFAWRVHFGVTQLVVARSLRIDGRNAPLLWAGREFTVIVDISLKAKMPLNYLRVQDRPPSGCDRIEGADDTVGILDQKGKLEIRYRLICPTPGEVRFEGVRVQAADLHGFFYYRTFIRCEVILPVLPPLTDAEGDRRTAKSHNLLPPPGVHRLRFAGSGSELLDLRDYQTGDPPRMIAWKLSARRDRLIIKEFESDVPVRCTLFLDASQSVRIGPTRQTSLHRLVTIASGVAQAAASDRDLVGLVVFDEESITILKPARGSRHLIEILRRLAKAASALPLSTGSHVDNLTRLALPLMHELYPELMDKRVNSLGWKMFWKPAMDTGTGWLVIFLVSPLLLMLGTISLIISCFEARRPEPLPYLVPIVSAVFGFFGTWVKVALALGLPAMLGFLIWAAHGLSGFFGESYRRKRRRKSLALPIAVLEGASLGKLARWLEDDPEFGIAVQSFLAKHHRRHATALYDERGEYLFRSPGKVEVLSRALLYSIAHARDNELFVLMVDLIELEPVLGPLLAAVRVAVARHHHVMVISPWLAGVPYDADGGASGAPTSWGPEGSLYRLTAGRYNRAYLAVRRAFAKLGVPVVRAEQEDQVRTILNRLDRLRGIGARR